MDDVKEIQAAMDRGDPISKEQADFMVRQVQRLCKGPVKPDKLAEYGELRRVAGIAGGPSLQLLDSLNRDYCGYNFNELVTAFPYDGQEHVVHCPKCNLNVSFRSPIFKTV